jgi:hypothetical protein
MIVLLSFCAGARAQGLEDYLDIGVMKVKSERRADFDAMAKKLAAANRRHNGDHWIMFETIYGDQNTFTYVSPRPNYAAVEQAYGDFMSAMTKALGQPGASKLLGDLGSCVSSSRGELRRRRWDLSTNPPADADAMMKRVGAARWLRLVTVRVRPGRTLQFESQLKTVKEAADKRGGTNPNYVAQAVAGREGAIFYISWLTDTLGAFDSIPGLPQLLGADGFKDFQEHSAENVETAETIIARIVPELSNPPAAVAAAAPDFWNPKPAAAAKPKEKPDSAKP